MEIGFPREKLREYFNQYKYREITFDKDTVQRIGLIRREIYIIIDKARYPADIQRASMTSVEVTVRLPKEVIDKIKAAGKLNLNLSFMGLGALLIPISFGVSYSLAEKDAIIELGTGSFLLTLNLNDAPPGYLIGILGGLILSHAKETKRKAERIAVNADSSRRLGLKSMDTHLLIGEEKLECVLRDISFSGSKVIVQNRLEKGTDLSIELFFTNPDTYCRIPGTIVRIQPMPGGTNRHIAGIKFDENSIPGTYKERLHEAFD